MRRAGWGVLLMAVFVATTAEDCNGNRTSDDVQRRQQERVLMEGTSQIGMPAIKNFRERKLLKYIIEMRDQTGLVTFTYTYSDYQGTLKFLCQSIGYPIPYATQFTNPQKETNPGYQSNAVIAQSDPNGLFSPQSAEGTWVLCKDPKGGEVRPVYVEPRVIASPFPLP